MVLILSLTRRCNMRCAFCAAVVEDNGDFLDKKDAKNILIQAHKYGFRYVNFSGGEPLLHPNFKEIVNIATDIGYWIEIFTNGSLITKDIVDFLKAKNNISIRLSLYTLDRNKHKEITKTDSLEEVYKAICLLKSNMMYFGLGSTITYENNFDEIETLADFAFESYASYIRFTPVVKTYDYKNAIEDGRFYYILLKKIIYLVLKYKKCIKYENVKNINLDDFVSLMTTRRCSAGSGVMYVDEDKNLSPCVFLKSKYILDLDENMNDIFKKLKLDMQSLFEESQNHQRYGICKNCDYVSTCLGGCLVNRYVFGDSVNDNPSVCIYHTLLSILKELTESERNYIINYWYYHYQKTNTDSLKNCMRKLPIWELYFRMDVKRNFGSVNTFDKCYEGISS